MRTSSNPAFRNLPTSPGGYATFGHAPAGTGSGTGAAPWGASGAADRPLTVDDVVQKTALTAAVTLGVGVATYMSGLYGLGIVGALVGLVLALIIIFRRSANPALVLGYSAAEGVALGGFTGALQTAGATYSGTGGTMAEAGFHAILGVAGVFVGMFLVWKTGLITVTQRLARMVVGALIGVLLLMLVNLVVGFFTPGGLGLYNGSPLAIGFSLLCIAIGAFMLLLDFDQAENAVNAGVPRRFAWYLAFGFMTTLVWLYIEILRLLGQLRQ